MKLINVVESIILEATPQEIHNAYYSDIPYETFRDIALSDPGTVKSGNDVKKVGKYTKLLLNMFKRKNLNLEDLPKASEYLGYVYKHKTPLDVNKIQTLSDLYQIVKAYYVKDTKDLGSVLQALDSKEYQQIFKGQNWTIFKPLTEKAACYLGVNTEWCTTWGPNSLNSAHKDRSNQFQNYNSRDPLYIIINNNDLNLKYQFHFQSKSFMDKEDHRINSGEFLEKNPEIRNFFFPSFTKDELSDDEVKLELSRLSILSPNDSTKIIEKLSGKLSETNPLIKALIDRNEESLDNELIVDSNMRHGVEINGNDVVFYYEKLMGDLDSVNDIINYYESDIYNSGERIYDDVTNEDDEWRNERLEEYFTDYYNENKETLSTSYGILSYEDFKNEFFDNFKDDNQIKETYYDIYVRLNIDSFDAECQSMIDEIKKYISYSVYRGYTTVDVNIGYFILYLGEKGISKIGEDESEDVLNNYINHYNIQTEYEGIYDYNHRSPKYEDIKDDVEKYFDTLFDDYEGVVECAKVRTQLQDIIKRVFNGQTEVDNDKFKLEIRSLKVDCENKSVDVRYYNKETGETHEGPVKIENLATYATNYKLFESIRRFKQII
jgi:hypothetical protein